MEIKVIDECKELSLAGRITFPEVVMKLAGAGVERYIADMVGRSTYYYGIDNSAYSTEFKFDAQQVAQNFNATAVKSAITEIQQGHSNYKTFLAQIISAGCCHYEVFITGRKVIYFGRDGSSHTELFPSK